MSKLIFEDVAYFDAERKGLFTGSIEVKDGIISAVREYDCIPERFVLPGLIDLHFHGNSGEDFSDGNYEGLLKIARYHARHGVTRFSPASMTLPEETIVAACKNAARLREEKPEGCARIEGVTMEGPFFSEKKKGAQAAEYLRLPDVEMVKRVNEAADGLLKIVCVAPELEGAKEFIERVSKFAVVSVAHTDASYEQAAAGYAAGASHTTHLFNAMPPFLHREPGVIGAAAENEEVTVELISDGVHLHPSTVRMAFSLFGADRICLISDSMSACGMPDGKYFLGGQEVFVQGNRATLADGTIAGSATPLFACMVTAMSFGVPEEDAILSATLTPARVLGIDHETGSIAIGKRADLVICSEDYQIQEVYIDGVKVE